MCSIATTPEKVLSIFKALVAELERDKDPYEKKPPVLSSFCNDLIFTVPSLT